MQTRTTFQLLFLIGLSLWANGCSRYDPLHPDTANLRGIWGIDNTATRRADEKPVRQKLSIYATHMEYDPGQGVVGTQGEWKPDGFWCEPKNGTGKIEAVKITAPDAIQLQLAAFYPGNREMVTLYKEKGSYEEQKALAARYPPPFLYPPPQGAIREGMTEYQLKALPWKAYQVFLADPFIDEVKAAGEGSDDTVIYCYRSDDPHLVELRVMVKNRRVVSVTGGNG
jgi:hypothetical protein